MQIGSLVNMNIPYYTRFSAIHVKLEKRFYLLRMTSLRTPISRIFVMISLVNMCYEEYATN